MNPISPTKICAHLVSEKILRINQIAECQLLKEQQGPGVQKSILDFLVEKNYLTPIHLRQAEKLVREKDFEYGTLIDELEEFDSNVPERFVNFFEGYQLLKRLGKGGMGVVYLGKQLSMDREVAIKVLSKTLADDKEFVSRFMAEARVSAKFNHPNVVRGIDVLQQSGYHFLVMEFIEGKTTSGILKEQEISEELAIEIGYSIALALQYASSINIIHRDIKPDNIMVTHEGEIKLLDLGLAKEVEEESELSKSRLLGTPHFASPEQIRGENLDIRTDIYSLGATLFQLLTGILPFDGQNIPILLTRVLTEKTPNAKVFRKNLSEPFVQLVQKMMEKRKDKRVQTAEELVEEFQKLRKKYMPSYQEEHKANVQNQKNQTRMMHKNFILNELTKAGTSRTAQVKKRDSNQIFIIATPIVLGICLFLAFMLFKNPTSDDTGTSNTTHNGTKEVTDPRKEEKQPEIQKEDPKIKALYAQKELFDGIETSVKEELSQNFIAAGTVLDLFDKTETFLEKYPKSTFVDQIRGYQAQIKKKLEELGEREYQNLQRKEGTLVKLRKWEEAENIWDRFPIQLKNSSWATKAKEAKNSFKQRFDPFAIEFKAMQKLLKKDNIEKAKELLKSSKNYAKNREQRSQVADFKIKIDKREKELAHIAARKALKFQPDNIKEYPAEFSLEVVPLLQTNKNRSAGYKRAVSFLEDALERYPLNKTQIESDLFIVKTLQQAWNEMQQFFEKAAEKKEKVKIGTKTMVILSASEKEGIKTQGGPKQFYLEGLDNETFVLYAAKALKGFSDRPLKLGLFAYFFGDYKFAYSQLFKVRGENEFKIIKFVDSAKAKKEQRPEKEALKHFKEAKKYIKKKDYVAAERSLFLLQTLYINTLYVQERKKLLPKMYKKVKKDSLSFTAKVSSKLRKTIKGKITQHKSSYKISYDFRQSELLKDFETRTKNSEEGAWKESPDGLLGNSLDTLYWKPKTAGNFTVEMLIEVKSFENLGFSVMANGFHRQYLIYPLLNEDWGSWSKGKGVILSSRVKRQNSTQIANRSLDLNSFKIKSTGYTAPLHLKIEYRAGKIKFWLSEKKISKSTPPLLEGKAKKLVRGYFGISAGSPIRIQKMTIFCKLDPSWVIKELK